MRMEHGSRPSAMAVLVCFVLVAPTIFAHDGNGRPQHALVACKDRCLYEMDIDAGKVVRKSEPLDGKIGTPVALEWSGEDRVFLGCRPCWMANVSLVEIDTESLEITRQIGPWANPSGQQIEPGEIYKMQGFPAKNRVLVGCQGGYVLGRTELLIDAVSGKLITQVPLGDYGWLSTGGNELLSLQERGDTLIARMVDINTGEKTTLLNPDWEAIKDRFGPEPGMAVHGLRMLNWDPHRHAVVRWAVQGQSEPMEKSFEGMFGGGEAADSPHSTVDREGNRILVPVVASGGSKGYIVILRASDGAVLASVEVGPYPTNAVLFY